MIGRRAQRDAQSFDEAWAGSPTQNQEVLELVRCAEMLCEAAVVDPSPLFLASLRTQLMTEAETALVPGARTARTTTLTPIQQTHPIRRRVAGLTAALMASAGVIGLVSSSASAVPGEMLYPVKRTVESVQLSLHRDDASRGTYQLAQASERLAEASKLTSGESSGSGQLVVDTLEDFTSQAEAGSTSLFADYSISGSEQSIRTINDFAVASTVELSTISTQMPPEASGSFAAAREAVSDLATQSSALCSSCADADLQALVSAVSDLAARTPVDPASTSVKDRPTASHDPATSPSTSSTSGQSAPTPPVLPVPTPAPDPVLGGVTGLLLGDDDQVGLVPGLLDGLLGP